MTFTSISQCIFQYILNIADNNTPLQISVFWYNVATVHIHTHHAYTPTHAHTTPTHTHTHPHTHPHTTHIHTHTYTHAHTHTHSCTHHTHQVDKMAAIYVPYCTDKTASEELLASHRTYLFVSSQTFSLSHAVHAHTCTVWWPHS